MQYVVFVTSLLLLLGNVIGNRRVTFKICGEENNKSVTKVINSAVDRLMELRHPSWGWTNTPEVVLGLQLSAQNKFYGRRKSLEKMRSEIDDDYKEMSIGKLAQYILAIQSMCENPRNFDGRNLLKTLEKRIRKENPDEQYYSFGLALGTVCVNGGHIKMSVVRNLLKKQNEDGSFGDKHSVDDAAQMILALKCVGSGVRPRFLMKRVRESIKKLVNFLDSEVKVVEQNTFIGNKYSSPLSALALREADIDSTDTWKCKDVMKSLTGFDVPETEGVLSQRIPSLAGNSYLDLEVGWTCKAEVSIPQGYQPKCNPIDPQTCFPNVVGGIPISARLTIFTDMPHAVNENPNTDVSVIIKNGTKLHQAMIEAQADGLITFKTVSYSFGESVTSLQGVMADSSARQYWAMLNGKTGEILPVGISAYVPHDGDQIIFKLQTY
ncbi:transcobalamin-1-like [Styela clava]